MTQREDPLAGLIDADRGHAGPDDATLERAWSRVEHSVASGAAGPVLDTAPLLASGHGGLLTLVTVGLLAVVGLGGVALSDGPTPTTARAGLVTQIAVPAPSPAPAIAVVEAPEAEIPAPAEVERTAPARKLERKKRPKVVAAPSDPSASLVEEVQLMRKISRALSRNDLRTAKQLLARHRSEFPNGSLNEERDAAAVRVACGLGAANAASKRRAFERAWPSSIHAAAIQSSCD